MTATTCRASNSVFYQLQLGIAKSQLTPILCITTVSSSSSSSISVSHPERQIKPKETIHNDENNNQSPSRTNTHHNAHLQILDSDPKLKELDEAEFLACVGLRPKSQKRSLPTQLLRPLRKRLAVPVCLLPLRNNVDRVRQALNIVLPYVKFLSIIHDTEDFCSTDNIPDLRSASSRSLSHKRSSANAASKKMGKHRLSKAEFITLAADTSQNRGADTSMNRYVDSALHCHVALDRLDALTIDQLMKETTGGNESDNLLTSTRNRSVRTSVDRTTAVVPRTRNSLNRTTTETTTTRTIITTLTTEQTTVKQKSISTSFNPAKRLKTSHAGDNRIPDPKSSALSYQRIYLKCFICSKREFIDAQVTNSDILHSHWLAHDHELSLNIYDSEIDSILTRVVEFFHFPKRHALEGKIQTLFILNSEEVPKSPALPLSDDTCIVLD